MDQRALDTLAWLDTQATEDRGGAAYAETEVLRLLCGPLDASGSNILRMAYEADLALDRLNIVGRAAARDLAHRIMFASDFGRHQLGVSQGYGELLDTLFWQHDDDTDTLGELLIAAKCINHTSVDVTEAREAFDAAWSIVPREYENYHVILIGGLLYALG